MKKTLKNTFPPWLVKKLPDNTAVSEFENFLSNNQIKTVCIEAQCPNRGECFERKIATFLILGNICTRKCGYCAIHTGVPQPVDETEPEKIASTVKNLNISYVVVTSVTRDDLQDYGSNQFKNVIKSIKDVSPHTKVEVLIPDLMGRRDLLHRIISAQPDVISHNIETVPRLYRKIRPGSDYERSLSLIAGIKEINPEIVSKSGIMLGLGETYSEVLNVFQDLIRANCEILTIGQYLAPSSRHHMTQRYVPPEEFAKYREIALTLGFKYVESGPFVRSSYVADKGFSRAINFKT